MARVDDSNAFPDKSSVLKGAALSKEALDGRPMIDNKKAPYADPPKRKEKPVKNYELAKKHAPNRDLPTTADAKKGLLSLPAAMAAVDPQGLSAIAPMMYPMLDQVASLLSGGSQSKNKKVVEDALSGALALLSNKYTFDRLTLVFDSALKNDAIKLIDERYRSVVKHALANLYKNYVQYGEGNIPTTVVATVTVIGTAPSPLVETVPDLYVQQYYTQNNDPYPGYIKWVSQDETDTVYTERSIGDPYYVNADEEVYSTAEQELAVALEPYVIEINLTAQILNELLIEEESKVETNSKEKSGGKNSSQNLMSILMQLAGYAGVISNLQQSIQLPVSVLNKGSIKNTQQNFMKNIGQLRQAKEKARQAVKPRTPLSNFTSIVGNQKFGEVASNLKKIIES